jgi:hypothetical protein
MAYLTQDQAAVYSDVVAGLSGAKAAALLAVASSNVDAFCGRTFDTVLDELPAPVAMAVALWAEDLASGNDAGRTKTREKIGDYEVEYSDASDQQVSYACPDVVATLLGPYRIIVVG